MSSIGGYFELELRQGSEYHPKAIKLNNGRNALRYILEANSYQKVYLPLFSCDALLEPIRDLGLEFEYYYITANFEVQFDLRTLKEDECLICINYFGLKDEYVNSLAAGRSNVIVDNAHAFYAPRAETADSFYSPRKFFGVPDGGYLYTSTERPGELPEGYSYERSAHLLIRSDATAEAGYPSFLQNESSMGHADMCSMSSLTIKLLASIDYQYVADRRRENYIFFAETLGPKNGVTIPLCKDHVPLTYPFYSPDRDLRKLLLENKIYTASYWPNVGETDGGTGIEREYADKLVHLPVDQRMTSSDLERVVRAISL